MSKKQKEILQIKLVFLGDAGVGKTSIISRYVENYFSDDQMASSLSTYIEKIEWINKKQQFVKFIIWDTVGAEKYMSLSKLFYKDTDAFILIYSIANKSSLDSLYFWFQNLKNISDKEPSKKK